MNKQRIGIFGDSYGNLNLDRSSSTSWIDILEEKYDVSNYAEPALSFWHCYDRYVKFGKGNYYNVFIIPNYDRFQSNYLEQLLPKFIKKNYMTSWYNIPESIPWIRQEVEKHKSEIAHVDIILKVLDSLEVFWLYWQDTPPQRNQILIALENIKMKDSNILFIDVNQDSLSGDLGLTNLSLWELEQLQFKLDLSKGILDLRKNHLSEENNIILGNKILHAIENNLSELRINVNDFVVPNTKLNECVFKDHRL